MRNLTAWWLAAGAGVCAVQAWGQVAGAAAAQVKAQDALFAEQFESDLRLNPLEATAIGDYRFNDQLGDFSLAGARVQHAADRDFLAKLKAIATDGMGEQDKLSHEIMQRQLENRVVDFEMKDYEMPVDQMSSVATNLADLPLEVPLDSVKHYEDYVARLREMPKAFQQTEEVMRAGMADGLMPVKFLLEQVPGQCDGVVLSNPFLLPTKKYPAEISEADQKRLTAEITEVVNAQVMPAYKQFGEYVRTQYAPKGRTTLAVTSLPDGRRRYEKAITEQTTTHLTPEQIHQIGLDEIKRIDAEELLVAKRAGFADMAAFRASIKANPKYVPTSSEQILDDYRRYVDQMRPKLPQLFGTLPKAPVTVEAIPAFQSAMATHYNMGTADGKKPGRIVVATSDFKNRSLIDDEATAYHEGIPGHHMQISIAQELTGLPKFRQYVGFTAYVEGWALYSERLGKEVGFYQDPVSDYGRLNSEKFRAVRLVVDTGIHNLGWSRDQVIAFFRQSETEPEPEIQTETDRYITWPGQALAYKLGQLKISEMRARAEKALGPKFDIRRYHDEVLSGGALPLDLFEARVDGWIAAEKAR